MAKVTVTLDANLAIDVMMLSGARSPQDAVELIVRDYLERGRRTEARTAEADDSARLTRTRLRDTEG
jgi:Arc/MetJ family transcription regulator